MRPRSVRRLLTLGVALLVIGASFGGTLRAGDNLDVNSGGAIHDIFWDSRLFDGTQGFPGAILWHHNPAGMPSGLNQATFEARIDSAFNAWEAVDDGIPGAPLVPILNFGGQTSATDALALDGINTVAWRPEGFGGTLVVSPCWALNQPTTTISDGAGHALMPITGAPPIPFPGPAGVLYPVGTIIDCGMRFDSADLWSITESPGFGYDVQGIATHEAGHFIGISHSTLGDFTGASDDSATMLPFVGFADPLPRTLEEDDKASVLRTYARNRFGGPIAQTAGGRGLIELRLLQGAACQPASGLSVVAYRTSGGIDGPGRVETFSGSHLRAGILDEPANGSVTLNVLPLPEGESYTIYARTLEQGLGGLSSLRYNATTINANVVDPLNQSRTFDHLALVDALEDGESVDVGTIGILGCWVPVPGSPIDLVAQSVTAPNYTFRGSEFAVTSSFKNNGTAASTAFSVGVYFSADQTITSEDTFAGFACSVSGLAPGEVGTCNGVATAPNLPSGDYYVGLLVDLQNHIGEPSETNNGISTGHLTSLERNPVDPIVNGSFETGNLSGWTVKELTPASNPSLPISVRSAGIEYPAATFAAPPYTLDYFTSAPTDGQWAALHDFNGNDTATSGLVNRRELYQDVTLPAGTTTLAFEYRAAWELFRFGSTQPRTFSVELEPAGGGAAFFTHTVLVAPNNTIEEDTDNPSGGVGDYPPGWVDISAYGGQSVRVKFVWNIPEPGTGFGFFQLDDIRVNANVTSINTPPVVSVTSPANGSTFVAGASIAFAATANDTEDGDLGSSLVWTSSVNGQIGTGAGFSTTALSVGTHTITASVTDLDQAPGSDAISVTVTAPPNTAPTVSITAPANGTSVVAGTSITFTGTATDLQDGSLSSSLSWASNVSGPIGTGASVSTSALSVGTHTITASVFDSGLLSGSSSISLIVTPAPTDVDNLAAADVSTARGTLAPGTSFLDTRTENDTHERLTEARQGGGNSARSLLTHTWQFSVAAGAQYVFKVSAHHSGTEDDFVFSYSRDNVTFTSMPVVVTATTDTDAIQTYTFPQDMQGLVYVRVDDTDSTRGNTVLDTLFVDFMAITSKANGTTPTPPVVAISSPSNGATFAAGTSVSFVGSANDAEDGAIGAQLQWTSSINGSIGSGTSFSTPSLSAGTHTIMARVVDTSGLPGEATIVITINPTTSITLTAVGYKVKGIRTADLSWSGADGSVRILRNGSDIATGITASTYTDNIGGKGAGTFTYQVCQTTGGACSNVMTVTF